MEFLLSWRWSWNRSAVKQTQQRISFCRCAIVITHIFRAQKKTNLICDRNYGWRFWTAPNSGFSRLRNQWWPNEYSSSRKKTVMKLFRDHTKWMNQTNSILAWNELLNFVNQRTIYANDWFFLAMMWYKNESLDQQQQPLKAVVVEYLVFSMQHPEGWHNSIELHVHSDIFMMICFIHLVVETNQDRLSAWLKRAFDTISFWLRLTFFGKSYCDKPPQRR